MKNKKIILLIVILGIAVVGTVTFFIFRPRHQELLPQQFAELPEKPKLIAEFQHGATLDSDVIVPGGFSLTGARQIYSVSFSPEDASLIASVNANGSIKLWNINNTKEPIKILRHPGVYPTIDFSPTGELLASAGNGKLVLWDVASGMKLNFLETSKRQFAFTPDGHQLATVRNEVKLWDIRNPKQIKKIDTDPFDEAHKFGDWACAVSISTDGKLIAAGYANGSVNVWNLQTKQHVKTLRTPFIEMRYLKFSPDNAHLVCGGPVPTRYIYLGKGNHDSLGVVSHGAQGYIMWKLPDWQRHEEVQRGHVEDLVFSPDGQICASINRKPYSERGVELWSVESGAPITSLPMTGIPLDIAFSHDGNLLVTGNFHGVVQVWKHNAPQLEAATPSADVVRIIYALTKDKEPSTNITEKLDKKIREVQDFYADEMERHGFGRKTFTFETDENGKAKIYLVKYNQTDVDLSNDIWLSFVGDTSMPFEPIPKLYYARRIHSFEYTNKDGISTKDNVIARDIGGIAPGRLVSTSVRDLNRKSIAYLLRGTFSLPYIDDKYKPNILKRLFTRVNDKMPWGKRWAKLSKCEAEWLDKSRFFNPNQPFFDKRPKIEMSVSKVDSSDSRLFQFTPADEDGVHQVQLFVPTDIKRQKQINKFYDCQVLNGKKKETVVFEITDPEIKIVKLRMIDMHGNIASREFRIMEKTPEPSEKP